MPPNVVNFEDENGVDTDKAMQEACRNLANSKFSPNDLKFYFNQVEAKMAAVGVKKQYTKFQILATIIPPEVQDETKELLSMMESEFDQNDAYKQLKTEIISIFGPKPEEAMDRALSRVLTGKPSTLARQLVSDICTRKLECVDCPRIVLSLWKRQLPGAVRAGIAHCQFTKQTFKEVCQLADKIFDSQVASGTVAATTVTQNLNETQPAITYPVPEVAAVSRGGRGGRGGRGYRGGRGGYRGRGGGSNPSQTQTQQQPGQGARRGPKHPDLPDGEWKGCNMHFKWGKSSHFCSEPLTCPWKNVIAPKSTK